jgi:O-antigen ligase
MSARASSSAIAAPPANAIARSAGVLIGLLPLIVFFSGMAMTPFLVVLALLLVSLTKDLRAALLQPQGLRGLLVIAALLLAWPVLSIGWAIVPAISAQTALKTVTIVAVGLIAVLAVRSALLTPVAVDIFTASLIAVAVIVLLEKLPTGGLMHLRYPRPEDYEKFMVVHINRGLDALPVLIWPAVLAARRMKQRWPAWLLPLIAALPIAVMHSLSAKSAIVLGTGAYFLLRTWPRRGGSVLQFGVPAALVLWPIVFALGYGAVFANPAIYQRLPNSSQARVDIWKFALDHIRERPVLGWGMESSRSIPGGDESYMGGTRTYLPLHPHNSVFQVLLEQGVIGLALSLAAVALIIRALRRNADDSEALATGGALIVAYLMVGFTAFGMWQTWWIAVAWISAVLWRAAANLPRPLTESLPT